MQTLQNEETVRAVYGLIFYSAVCKQYVLK